MTRTVRAVCQPEIASGFALAGVPAEAAAADSETPAILAGLVRQPDAGVLLLQEDLHDRLPSEIRARLDRSAVPVIVPFPGPSWLLPVSAEERVVELLRQAIGYRVKLR